MQILRGDKEKDIEVAFRSVGFSIEKIDRDKKKIELIFDSPDFEEIYNKALKDTNFDIENSDKTLNEEEKGEIFAKKLNEMYMKFYRSNRVEPKKKNNHNLRDIL